MFGAKLRCAQCGHYYPDRCLCGMSITNPAIKESMRVARNRFEEEIRNYFGAHLLLGSPNYSTKVIRDKWQSFWQVWQTATEEHQRVIATLEEKVKRLEAGEHLTPIHLVKSLIYREGCWHEITAAEFERQQAAGITTRIVYDIPAPAAPAPQ